MNARDEVLVDVTELARAPVRTGIQRVTWEIITRWPGDRLIPFRIDDEGLAIALGSRELERLSPGFGSRHHLRAPGFFARGARLLRGRKLLVPEVFYDPQRLAIYERLLEERPDDVHFVLFDFLPQLRPELFHRNAVTNTMRYVRLAREARQVSFISAATRRDYLERICRDPAKAVGPALPLGADGLGVAPPRFDPARRGFAVIGTLEPRKGQHRVLSAFEGLWARGVAAPLTLVGGRGWLEPSALARIERAVESGAVRWLRTADDALVRRTILECRATLFPSVAEGFGLPPVESLALGVPVIASRGIPSLEGVSRGVSLLEGLDQERIASAVESLLDDANAASKVAELEGHVPRTWATFAAELAAWVTGGARSSRA